MLNKFTELKKNIYIYPPDNIIPISFGKAECFFLAVDTAISFLIC